MDKKKKKPEAKSSTLEKDTRVKLFYLTVRSFEELYKTRGMLSRVHMTTTERERGKKKKVGRNLKRNFFFKGGVNTFPET